MVSELAVGEVTVRTTDGKVEKLFLSGGYLKLDDNKVLVLADVAKHIQRSTLIELKKLLKSSREIRE